MKNTKKDRGSSAVAPVQGPAGDRILEAASDLLRNQRIRAVGVETIVKQAGVAKISRYPSFVSKDDLIVAYFSKLNATYWAKSTSISRGMIKSPVVSCAHKCAGVE